MKKCFFWGATGQAKVLHEFIGDFEYRLTWLFDNNLEILKKVKNIPVLGGWKFFIKWVKQVDPKNIGFLIAIGGDRGKVRLELQNKIREFGFHPLTVWHKSSYISKSVIIGEGSQILARATVCIDVTIGRACIVNTSAQIDHECELDDGVHVMPGAILTGCIKVGKFATIGSGAIIFPRINIGEGAIIGAGTVITKDVPPYSVIVGNPGRIIRKIKTDYKNGDIIINSR